MFTITLEVTQKCNLNCSYCYVGEKDNSEMSFSVATQAIQYAVKRMKNYKDKDLKISFIGGEPLMNYKLIQEVVAYCNQLKEMEDIRVKYAITTNVLLLNEEIMEFMIANKFSLKVSLDGNKEINDTNRKFRDGSGTYDLILSKAKLLGMFQKKTGKLVQLTNVITKNNYTHYYDTLVFLTKELGFRFIDSGIDHYIEWEKDELEIIRQELEKSLKYFIDCFHSGEAFYWRYIFENWEKTVPSKKLYSCGAGIISMYIRTNGDIYACPSCFKDGLSLGNIMKGVKYDEILKLSNFNKIENKTCEECNIFDFCRNKGCAWGSITENNDINKPTKFGCWMEKISYQLVSRNREELENIMNNFQVMLTKPYLNVY